MPIAAGLDHCPRRNALFTLRNQLAAQPPHQPDENQNSVLDQHVQGGRQVVSTAASDTNSWAKNRIEVSGTEVPGQSQLANTSVGEKNTEEARPRVVLEVSRIRKRVRRCSRGEAAFTIALR